MTATRDAVVAAARGWIGTPYRHQASCKRGGTDCLGLIRGVWREVYGAEPADVPPYTMDWAEPEKEEVLWSAAAQHLVACPRSSAPQPGDVLLFRMRRRSVAKHLGILTEGGPAPRFVHAYSGHGVVESPLSTPWHRRVVARFQFPK